MPTTKQKRRWVLGKTIGKLRLSSGTYYFVDDRNGGRAPASDLEVILWKRLYGSPPLGPDHPNDKE